MIFNAEKRIKRSNNASSFENQSFFSSVEIAKTLNVLPGIQPHHSIGILKKNIIHRNHAEELAPSKDINIIYTKQEQTSDQYPYLYTFNNKTDDNISRIKKNYVYESHENQRNTVDANERPAKVLVSKTVESDKNQNDDSRSFYSKYEKFFTENKTYSENPEKRYFDGYSRFSNRFKQNQLFKVHENSIEKDISRILKDEENVESSGLTFEESRNEKEIFEANKLKENFSKQNINLENKGKNMYKGLFGEILEEKFSENSI